MPLWVQHGYNIYKIKKAVLKDDYTPHELKIAPYDVATYHNGIELEDDVLIEEEKFNRMNPLVLVSKESKCIFI